MTSSVGNQKDSNSGELYNTLWMEIMLKSFKNEKNSLPIQATRW
jgi:hypothetical protein